MLFCLFLISFEKTREKRHLQSRVKRILKREIANGIELTALSIRRCVSVITVLYCNYKRHKISLLLALMPFNAKTFHADWFHV